MRQQIFPKEILDTSVEVFQFRYSGRTRAIYLIIVVTILGLLALLPFVKVNIYTSAKGIIRPLQNRTSLTVINSGSIIYSNLKENVSVSAGDTLLVIDNNGIDHQLELANYQTDETISFMDDLSYLNTSRNVNIERLQTAKYRKLFLEYSQKLENLTVHYQNAKRNFERNEILYRKNVISKLEYEDKKFQLDIAKNDINQLRRSQLNIWQTELIEYTNLSKELENNTERLFKSKSQFVVIAPINGTLMNVKPQEEGSQISIGTTVGEISPDTDLMVECFVQPKDIGIINPNTSVNFQIDAFNYNQWGKATGRISEISKDIVLVENQPVFRVECRLNEEYLTLKNGVKGSLKKGMTLNANFRLSERTLFDLLYDNVDDWLNPNRNQAN